MLGFVRQGSKWGWKMGLFAGIFRLGGEGNNFCILQLTCSCILQWYSDDDVSL